MKNALAHIEISVQPIEILQVICESNEIERLVFKVDGKYQEKLPSTGDFLGSVDFSKRWIAQPPEVARVLLHRFVAQKLESIPDLKYTGSSWLQSFGLEEFSSRAIADLSDQALLRLQFLVAIVGQHAVIQISSPACIDDCSTLLWNIKHFLLRLKHPLIQPAFVICDTDISPSLAFSVERLLLLEEDVLETICVVT